MIGLGGTFEYKGEFTKSGWEGPEIVVQAKSINPSEDTRLVGHDPKVRFWNGRLILDATEREYASKSTASFAIGDVVELVAQPGDALNVVRTGCGGIGLSILRHGELMLALGAVSCVPLGKGLAVSGVVGFTLSPAVPMMASSRHDYIGFHDWVGFEVGEQQAKLRVRESAELDGYHIYVEGVREDGTPGVDECVSITRSQDWKVRNAAMRSVILNLYGRLVFLDW